MRALEPAPCNVTLSAWVRLRVWARRWHRFARAGRMGRTPQQRRRHAS
jgi:hypothetical protein